MRQALLVIAIVLAVVGRAHYGRLTRANADQTKAMLEPSPELEAALRAAYEDASPQERGHALTSADDPELP